MSKIEGYIEKAREDFIPILEKLRGILLKDEFQLEEGWKWRAPNYDHKGMVCWLAHFKNHVGLNFFKGSLIEDLHGLYDEACMDKGNTLHAAPLLKAWYIKSPELECQTQKQLSQ